VFICEDIHMLGTIKFEDGKDEPRVDMLDNWLLVEPDEGQKETLGLEVPEAFRNKQRIHRSSWTGTVKSTGEYVNEDEEVCRVGDHIAYETMGAVSIMLEDKPHVVIYENRRYGSGGQSVQAILEEDQSHKEAVNA